MSKVVKQPKEEAILAMKKKIKLLVEEKKSVKAKLKVCRGELAKLKEGVTSA